MSNPEGGPSSPTTQDVSRETLSPEVEEKLAAYQALLLKWNKAYNLIGASTEADLRTRHVEDCLQLAAFLPTKAVTILDLGSGAGLPGAILAILGYKEVHLVESSLKKGLFLGQVKRALSLDNMTIHAKRIEEMDAFPVDVVTARAFAPLPRLLEYGAAFSTEATAYVLLKGEKVAGEIAEALPEWSFQHETYPSQTRDASGKTGHILHLRHVEKRVD